MRPGSPSMPERPIVSEGRRPPHQPCPRRPTKWLRSPRPGRCFFVVGTVEPPRGPFGETARTRTHVPADPVVGALSGSRRPARPQGGYVVQAPPHGDLRQV